MTRSITVCAYNRPGYLYQVLRSLIVSLRDSPSFDRPATVIGIDPGGDRIDEVKATAIRFADAVHPWIKTEIIVWPEHMGVSEAPRRLLQYVFMERQSEFNVHLEDDTVLSPDALALAEWYRSEQRTDPRMWDKIVCLNLFAYSGADADACPERVARTHRFGSWGWACTYLSWWLWFSHHWNAKREPQLGFEQIQHTKIRA